MYGRTYVSNGIWERKDGPCILILVCKLYSLFLWIGMLDFPESNLVYWSLLFFSFLLLDDLCAQITSVLGLLA